MSEISCLKDLFGLQGRVALVTGGTSGIGKMIASGFVECGVRTYITGRNASGVQSAADEICARGNCIPITVDLAKSDGASILAARLRDDDASLDILVNNAGTQWHQPIDSFSEEGWDSVLDLNLKSVFFVAQALLPSLRRAASRECPARIINIGSIGGLHVSSIENYSYSAAKAGLHHLTRALAKRLAGEHITVNAIAPGPFPSKMTEAMDDAFLEGVAAQTPLGRMGRPSDIAGTAIYLAAKAGAYVTGTVIAVDGGIVAAL